MGGCWRWDLEEVDFEGFVRLGDAARNFNFSSLFVSAVIMESPLVNRAKDIALAKDFLYIHFKTF